MKWMWRSVVRTKDGKLKWVGDWQDQGEGRRGIERAIRIRLTGLPEPIFDLELMEVEQ